jgi:predicted RNA-binding protein YlqC (UPF0109 family)
VKRLLETLAQGLCEHKARVRVSASEAGDELRLELGVAPADRGRVIGKNGRTADALRALLQAAARERGRRVVLEILT